MDTELLTTISSVASATKMTIEAVRAALTKSKANQETLALASELQTRIFQLQEIAFRLHDEKMQAFKAKSEALEENTRLRDEIRRKEEGTADRENYERRNIRGFAVVVRKDEPGLFLCATCFDAGKKIYLSKIGVAGISHKCSNCNGMIGRR